jgi:DNA-binding NarL/FixJ family response regulator
MKSTEKIQIIFGTAERLMGEHVVGSLNDQGFRVTLTNSLPEIKRILSEGETEIVMLDESIAPPDCLDLYVTQLKRYNEKFILILNGGNTHISKYLSIKEVKGVVSRYSRPDELVKCIENAFRAEYYIDRSLFGEIMHAPEKQNIRIQKLTNREIEVCRLLAYGLTRSMIADNLYISKRTVDTHIQRIRAKLNIGKHIYIRTYFRYHTFG